MTYLYKQKKITPSSFKSQSIIYSFNKKNDKDFIKNMKKLK